MPLSKVFISLFSLLLVSTAQAFSEEVAAPAKTEIPQFGLPKKQAVLAQGQKVYARYCIGCHGAAGDGKGPAAKFLNPKPRDFTTALFRFQSRPSGQLPTDQDLYRTLTEGLHGTSMPSWRFVPEDDRYAVIEYLKTFAPGEWDGDPEPVTLVTEDPYVGDEEAGFKRGEMVYHGLAQCYSCHAAYIKPDAINRARAEWGMPPLPAFRENLGEPKPMTTSEGYDIIPPDFTWDKMKRGRDLETLYHSVGNGISGTPMPTWKGILEEEDLWGLVYYVYKLTGERPRLVTEETIKKHRWFVEELEASRIKFEAEQKKLKAEREAAEAAAKAKAAKEAEKQKEEQVSVASS